MIHVASSRALVIVAIGSAIGAGALAARIAGAQPAGSGRGRLAFAHALPKLDGSQLQMKLVEVTYGPGEASAPHSHPCAVVGHVVEGAIRSQVKGEAEAVYKAGESFYEAPNGEHVVSANASTSERARLLAYFTCDRDTPLSVAVPNAHH